MKFQTATKVTNSLVICSVALCVVGLILGADYAGLRMILTAAALLLLSAALIVTLAIMNGFQSDIKQKIIDA